MCTLEHLSTEGSDTAKDSRVAVILTQGLAAQGRFRVPRFNSHRFAPGDPETKRLQISELKRLGASGAARIIESRVDSASQQLKPSRTCGPAGIEKSAPAAGPGPEPAVRRHYPSHHRRESSEHGRPDRKGAMPSEPRPPSPARPAPPCALPRPTPRPLTPAGRRALAALRAVRPSPPAHPTLSMPPRPAPPRPAPPARPPARVRRPPRPPPPSACARRELSGRGWRGGGGQGRTIGASRQLVGSGLSGRVRGGDAARGRRR